MIYLKLHREKSVLVVPVLCRPLPSDSLLLGRQKTQINLCGRDRLVTEMLLELVDSSAALEIVNGETVPKAPSCADVCADATMRRKFPDTFS